MYSLHDITSVCPKQEPASDEGEFSDDEELSNHSLDAQMERMSDEIPLNNNTVQMKTESGDISVHEGTAPNSNHSHNNILISQASDILPDQTVVTNTTAGHTDGSEGMIEGQIINGYTTSPVYEKGSHEEHYYPVSSTGTVVDAETVNQGIHTYNVESRMIPQQYGVPDGLPAYQSSIYGTMPYVPMTSKGEFSTYRGLSVYSGTHRSLTLYEMGLQRKPCCNCPCHLPASSPVLTPAPAPAPAPVPVPQLKSQRPSVIMVPSKNEAFLNSNSKVDSIPHRLMVENNLRRDLQQNGLNEMVDSDSSDDDEDGKREKYFRVNLDGATARFKLTNEDWERIPINTFPSGGRLLSGDWTRIFLSKVKESNPWCSLRFKNNHVRSENSRKIHSAVFFRGGAECKRPECNVKVRFVIRKERGKHVDVTYVGNVCHRRQPGGSDETNDKKRRQARRGAFLPA